MKTQDRIFNKYSLVKLVEDEVCSQEAMRGKQVDSEQLTKVCLPHNS